MKVQPCTDKVSIPTTSLCLSQTLWEVKSQQLCQGKDDMEQGADMIKCHFQSFKAQQQGVLIFFNKKDKKTAKTQALARTWFCTAQKSCLHFLEMVRNTFLQPTTTVCLLVSQPFLISLLPCSRPGQGNIIKWSSFILAAYCLHTWFRRQWEKSTFIYTLPMKLKSPSTHTPQSFPFTSCILDFWQ